MPAHVRFPEKNLNLLLIVDGLKISSFQRLSFGVTIVFVGLGQLVACNLGFGMKKVIQNAFIDGLGPPHITKGQKIGLTIHLKSTA